MQDSCADRETMQAVVGLAGRAPSVFNIQPWRWHIGTGTLNLLLDRSRALPVVDPGFRELTISCGAALDHAVLAFRALGWQVRVHRLPDPAAPDRLAVIEVVEHAEPPPTVVALAGAACTRHSDRRQYTSATVPPSLLHELTRAGEQAGARILVAEGDRRYALARAFAKAAVLHGAWEDYRTELAAWTGLEATAWEGIPQKNAPQPGMQYGDLVLRDFGRVAIAHEETGTPHAVGTLLLASTDADDPLAHLQTGEATSAILCAAELKGLSGSVLSEAFEIDRTRADVRRTVLDDTGHAQLAFRVGWPTASRRPPPTHRRPVQDVIRALPDAHSEE